MTALTASQIAVVCHEANRALQIETCEERPSPHWDDAPEWQRGSSVEGVHKALAGATPEELHQSWCDHKTAAGWTYGPVKDEALKQHPCLVPYADLPEIQRLKDHLFGAVVGALSAG